MDNHNTTHVFSKFGFFRSKHLLSSLSIVVIFISVLGTIYQQKKWQTTQGYVINDVRGYYAYLPYQFIFDDLAFETANKEEVWYSISKDSTTRFMKYTTGMAIAYAPGFFVAHAVSKWTNLEENGNSFAYQISFIITALVFLLIALNYSKKLLLLHFNDAVSSTCILLLFLGTNLFHYCTSYLSYAHLYSYALLVTFLFYSIQWLKAPNLKKSIIIGFVAGWFILIRPIDVLFIFFPILYQITSFKSFKNRLIFIGQHLLYFIPIVLSALVVWIPQLLYLYVTFGEIKLNTYSQEKFYFDSPHLFDSLFSFRDGWLIYSPLMLLAILGVLLFCFKKRYYMYVALILMYWYILASWWCWWYQGFGNRAFINLYPLLILPLGLGVTYLFKQKWSTVVSKLAIVFGIFLSLFQTAQFEVGAYTPGQQTWEAYKENFLEKQASLYYYSLLEKPEMDSAMLGKNYTYKEVFDTLSTQKYNADIPYSTPGYFPILSFDRKGANCISIVVNTSEKVNEKDFLFLNTTDKELKIQEFTRVKNKLLGNSTLHYFAVFEEEQLSDTLALVLSKKDKNPYHIESFHVNWLKKERVLHKNE